MSIEYLGTSILFEDAGRRAALNQAYARQERDKSAVRRKNAYFPGLAVLPSGDLIALFVISEAFESADATTLIARSRDLGRSWELEGALRDLSSRGKSLESYGEHQVPEDKEKSWPPESRTRSANRLKKNDAENGNIHLQIKDGPGGQVINDDNAAEKTQPGIPRSDYLKPSVLLDGTVVAIGYCFYRRDPDAGISIEKTGGILPGENIIAFSSDEGRTWTPHCLIPRSRPELYEISGPCIELRSGDLVAVAAPFRMPDGSNPSGQLGVLLRSKDRGQNWSDGEIFFRSPGGNLTPYESRICEMQPGRLVAIVWAYDAAAGRHYPNHVAVSHDHGQTWSLPIDTGHQGQASNLIWVDGDRLMTIHAHRSEHPGIYVRLVDLKEDRWTPLEEMVIYGAGSPAQTTPGQSMSEMFAALKFGQPSLLPLPDGEILAAHWTEEEGVGKIRVHRLRLR